jgi:hypothetical protein
MSKYTVNINGNNLQLFLYEVISSYELTDWEIVTLIHSEYIEIERDYVKGKVVTIRKEK